MKTRKNTLIQKLTPQRYSHRFLFENNGSRIDNNFNCWSHKISSTADRAPRQNISSTYQMNSKENKILSLFDVDSSAHRTRDKDLPNCHQKGMALLETLTLMIVFIVLAGYMLGFFSVVHSGIKNSIAARNLAFESFRNRSDLRLWRDNNPKIISYYKDFRWHSTISENTPQRNVGGPELYSTGRRINYIGEGRDNRNVSGELNDFEIQKTNTVWVKTAYGICLTAEC